MSKETLGVTIDAVHASERLGSSLCFVWHAGEPLTVGHDFLEEAFARVETRFRGGSRRVAHSIQTNGMLLNEAWVDLFERYTVRLGLSIDGPAYLHDRYRKTRSGRGTHAHVMRSVELLHRRAYDFSVIMVVTREALDRADDIFDFFMNLGVSYVGLNVEELELANTSTSLQGDEVPALLRGFFRRLLERQESANRQVRFREFEPFTELLNDARSSRAEKAFSRSSLVVPFAVVNVDLDGNFSTFCPELLGASSKRFGDFRMGRVDRDPIDSILENPIFRLVLAEIKAGVSRCEQSCDYWRFCGGGNPANKYFEAGRFDVSETRYCQQHKQAVVNAVLDFAEAKAARAAC